MPGRQVRSLEDVTEELAAIEHERWSDWQRYVHEKGVRLPDGSITLPPELVQRWERQMGTDYAHLSEAEKESDREQVRRYLGIVMSHFEAPEDDKR